MPPINMTISVSCISSFCFLAAFSPEPLMASCAHAGRRCARMDMTMTERLTIPHARGIG